MWPHLFSRDRWTTFASIATYCVACFIPYVASRFYSLLLQDHLRIAQAGYSTAEAENGAVALSMLRSAPSGHFCCMVLDLCMPVLNGYDTVRAVRTMELASPYELRLPVFCCTSEQLDASTSIHPEHTVHQHSLLCGFDEVMVRV